MLIDWFTVGAQALNFLVLMWLMRRFLYQPILDAIDAREARIAAQLADAAETKAGAQREREEFQNKNDEIDGQRAALLGRATDEAGAERRRLLDAARTAADAVSARRQDALKKEIHDLHQSLSRLTQQEVFAIARKALTDLATTSLEERIVEAFTRRVKEMDATEAVAEDLKTASAPPLVRSAFELSAVQRAAIQTALNETFSADLPLRFEIAPELIAGVELTTSGRKVAWSIADYLASLEKGVGELLDAPATSAPSRP